MKINPKYNISGKRFGFLTVVEPSRRTKLGKLTWLCACDCGGSTETQTSNLKSGHTQSCGCFCKEQTSRARKTHGESGSVEHRTWKHIKMRCYNPKDISYKNYGGRGISICDRWKNSFEDFLEDMGKKPTPLHSIDRFPNNDGNYQPGNCRWATRVEQNNNRRNIKK